MSNFNGDKVLLARQLHGFSQKALAEKVNINQSSLSKIEKGDLIPSDETIKDLMLTLGFPQTFFQAAQNEHSVAALSFHGFRKKSSVPVSKVNKILAEITIKNIHLDVINNYYKKTNIDISKYSALDIKNLASTLRKEWKINTNPISNLTEYIEAMGIDIFLCDFSDAQVDGVTSKSTSGNTAIFINKNQPGDRYRFSLAHELCHFLKHANEPICTKEMEDEANAFAAELLMPEDVIKDDLRTTNLADYARLKKKWKVSMAALIFRAKTIGAITPNQSTSLWKQMAMHGFRKVEPFPIEIETPKQIHMMLKQVKKDNPQNFLNTLNLTTHSFELLYKDFYDSQEETAVSF